MTLQVITPQTLSIVDVLVHLHPDSLQELGQKLTEEAGQKVIDIMTKDMDLDNELSLNEEIGIAHFMLRR